MLCIEYRGDGRRAPLEHAHVTDRGPLRRVVAHLFGREIIDGRREVHVQVVIVTLLIT